MTNFKTILTKNPTDIFVSDIRPDPSSTTMIGQVCWYDPEKKTWIYQNYKVTPAEYTEEGIRPHLTKALKKLGFTEKVPDVAIKMALRETQSIFILHTLGWGHINSSSCKYCINGKLKKEWTKY